MIILIFDNGKTSSRIAQIQNIQTWNYNSNNISNSRKFKKIHWCTSLAYLMLKPYVLMYFCQKTTKKYN